MGTSAYGAQTAPYDTQPQAYDAQPPASDATPASQPSSAHGSSGAGVAPGSTYDSIAPTYASPAYSLPPGYGIRYPVYQPLQGGFQQQPAQQPGAYQQPAAQPTPGPV